MMNARITISFASFLCLASSTLASTWSHWRGPLGNGSSPDAKLPLEWSETKNVKWKVPVNPLSPP